MSWMFDYIGDTIRNIAKVLFYICFVGGVIVLVIGLFRFGRGADELDSYSKALSCTWEDAIIYEGKYADAYYGKMQLKIGFYIVLSSFTMLPVYAIGELVDSCQEISRNTAELVNKEKDKE